ncbi:MAG: urea transporter ATP-binding subunit UrtE [Dehalococcoidia bacterium]|nr:urea transporter ATP-binding subunit UrtE [Dehalococcoidia bacterium]
MLRLEGVGAAYGKGQVVWDIDLEISGPHAALALLGRNGVGKTTLLRTIIGLHPSCAGHIIFQETDVTKSPPHERVQLGMAYVPQGRGIFPHLTVEENLRMGMATLTGGTTARSNALPEAPLALFPRLKELLGRKGGNLSGGEQQQLAIGRALAAQPQLLLLDEPTEGIQPSVVIDIEAALQRIRNELGVAVLLVEQHLELAWRFADQYCVMQKGRVVEQGSTKERDQSSVNHFLAV